MPARAAWWTTEGAVAVWAGEVARAVTRRAVDDDSVLGHPQRLGSGCDRTPPPVVPREQDRHERYAFYTWSDTGLCTDTRCRGARVKGDSRSRTIQGDASCLSKAMKHSHTKAIGAPHRYVQLLLEG